MHKELGYNMNQKKAHQFRYQIVGYDLGFRSAGSGCGIRQNDANFFRQRTATSVSIPDSIGPADPDPGRPKLSPS